MCVVCCVVVVVCVVCVVVGLLWLLCVLCRVVVVVVCVVLGLLCWGCCVVCVVLGLLYRWEGGNVDQVPPCRSFQPKEPRPLFQLSFFSLLVFMSCMSSRRSSFSWVLCALVFLAGLAWSQRVFFPLCQTASYGRCHHR